jgi:hypothetical protein
MRDWRKGPGQREKKGTEEEKGKKDNDRGRKQGA